MRRTYRSKKDMGGGLDYRDMLFNMDEKSSAFDAFYIHNIKQIKKEQSSMSSLSNCRAASNRVRKRKLVKRLAKEVTPPPKESFEKSLSGSIFLTPDKSLRVKKAPDPFDQLLNSSPACPEVKQVKKVDMFDKILADTPKETKKYNRKKKFTKKFNYSSNESSDSEKENSVQYNKNTSQNKTDIKAHKLVIEKETETIPEFDESINNIVKKLSLINNINGGNFSGSLKKSFKCYKNRLTKNFQSPLVKTSPLSSTPFMDKTRSKSIYKFSPIPIASLEDSPKYLTIMEDDNDINKSIVFIPKNNSNVLKRSKNEDSPNANTDTKYGMECKGNSNPLFSSEADTQENISKDKIKPTEIKAPPKTNENIDLFNVQSMSLQTSEIEPFFGFSNKTVNKYFNEEEKDDSIILSAGKASKYSHKSQERYENNSNENIENKSDDNYKGVNENKSDMISSIEYTVSLEPFLGFSEQNNSITNVSLTEQNYKPKQSSLFVTEAVKEINKADSDVNVSLSEPKYNNSVGNISVEETRNKTVKNYDNQDHSSQCEYFMPQEPFVGFNEQNNSIINISTIERNDRPKQSPLFVTEVENEVSKAESKIIESHGASKYNDSVSYISDKEIIYDTTKYSDDEHSSQCRNSKELSSFDSHKDIHEEQSEEPCDDYDDKNSLYDTCYSDTSFKEDSIQEEPLILLERMNMDEYEKYKNNIPNTSRVPVVAIERISQETLKKYHKNMLSLSKPQVALKRMDMDLFKKYYDNMPENSDDGVDYEEVISDDYASFEDSDYSVDEQTEENSDYTYAETDVTSRTGDADFCRQETSSSENEEINIEGDKCISFVTTRRGNEFINYSTIVVLDDSQESISSEINKTVISNHKKSFPSPTEDVANTVVGANDENIIVKDFENETHIKDKSLSNITTEMSNITTRKSKLCRESDASNSMNVSKTPEPISGIILQPGKKWERSLSIYRRMTVNDHFDHSVLEDENMHNKGRKYRQSVINTMELQGSLHNDSIHSRRSTFVSKPTRSTIRIVKETNNSRLSLSSTAVFDDLKGFLEDCDDTIVELSKLSLVDDHDVTVIEKFHEASRIATARDYVLRRCNQSDTIPFDECYPDPLLKNCRKIGEGVYGEVFLWRAPDGRARVMKVVPIAGLVKVNGEQQKDFHEIIAEIVIAMELSALRAPIPEIECHFNEGKDVESLDLHSVENATDVFNEVLAVRCVYGSYPSRLLDLWELYDETKGSENDNPAILPADQQYIVLELANAGQDLESFQFTSADQAHALFLQVAFALAVGEEAFQFEHRDLHWGNVLIAPTDQKYATFVIRGRAHRVARRGVAATIIDYSLSRLSLPLGVRERDADSAALYNDLAADEGLFGAVGDYQFEVYRLMRDKLGNEWKNFEPYTNILWLHYVADKMITALRYKRTATKTHKQYIHKLKAIKHRVLSYGSAAQFVLTDNELN